MQDILQHLHLIWQQRTAFGEIINHPVSDSSSKCCLVVSESSASCRRPERCSQTVFKAAQIDIAGSQKSVPDRLHPQQPLFPIAAVALLEEQWYPGNGLTVIRW